VSTATIQLDIPKIFVAQESKLLPEQAREFLISGREEDLSLPTHGQVTEMIKKGQDVQIVDVRDGIVQQQQRRPTGQTRVHRQIERERVSRTLSRAHLGYGGRLLVVVANDLQARIRWLYREIVGRVDGIEYMGNLGGILRNDPTYNLI
jgi:hypothetical protein